MFRTILTEERKTQTFYSKGKVCMTMNNRWRWGLLWLRCWSTLASLAHTLQWTGLWPKYRG